MITHGWKVSSGLLYAAISLRRNGELMTNIRRRHVRLLKVLELMEKKFASLKDDALSWPMTCSPNKLNAHVELDEVSREYRVELCI